MRVGAALFRTMKKKEEDLEYVEGISRFHERMWIERDEDGSIKEVYNGDLEPIGKHMLYRCFTIETVENGFYYKGEFIELENAYEYARKRALGYQRRKRGHTLDQVL